MLIKLEYLFLWWVDDKIEILFVSKLVGYIIDK